MGSASPPEPAPARRRGWLRDWVMVYAFVFAMAALAAGIATGTGGFAAQDETLGLEMDFYAGAVALVMYGLVNALITAVVSSVADRSGGRDGS